jgi:adenylate cyclase
MKRGRMAALLLLCFLSLNILYPQYSPWGAAQLLLFDYYQRVFPREPGSQPVVIVEIDEASLKKIGQWPWPRNRTAELIEAIAAYQPLAIGLDFYMPEPDQTSPARVAANLLPGQEMLASALAKLPSHETRLAQALSRAPTILGAAGFDYQTLTTSSSLRSNPVQIIGGDALPLMRHFPFVLTSLPELQAAARGQALLSVDPEGDVVRRVPLIAAVNDQPVAAMAMEMLRIATNSEHVQVQVGAHGITSVSVADLTIPTQQNGEVWLHFARNGPGRYVSAADVLEGTVSRDRFENKLVLVGLTGLGLTDFRTSPLDEHLPGVDIQAQLIESFFDGRFLLRPDNMRYSEFVLLVLGGLLLVWAVPATKPRISMLLAVNLYLMLLGSGFILFRSTGLLLDTASLIASLILVFASLLSSVFIETDLKRRKAEAEVQLQRINAARVAGELAAARRIQLGSLPQAESAFPGETRFEIAALLEPALEVGGDLYDFYMLDQRHLFFVVGDVSGKGLPASLFMAVTKALAKSAALRVNEGLASIVATASREMSRENPESLFVTLLAGILDVDSGEVELCNAGHDNPWCISTRGAAKIDMTGGPPLCVLDDFSYPVTMLQLSPGDILYLITDGITEAMNADNEQYGNTRLLDVLTDAGSSAKQAVAALHASVITFVGDAKASDDLTLLAVHFIGH